MTVYQVDYNKRQHYNHTSEEEVEIFHSTLRRCRIRNQTAESLARNINFHGAKQRALRQWISSGVARQYAGGPCVEHHPAAIHKISEGITALFRKISMVSTPLVHGEEGKWCSSVLGSIEDCTLPIPLQASACIHGMPHVLVPVPFKVQLQDGLDIVTRCMCGHVRDGSVGCSTCLQFYAGTAHAVLESIV